MFSVTTTQLCSCKVKQPWAIRKPMGTIVLQHALWTKMGSRPALTHGHSLPISDLINCSAFHPTGMNPNSSPWRTRPSNLTSAPLALPPMLHPDLLYGPQTLRQHGPSQGPRPCCASHQTTLPHFFLQLPQLQRWFLREACANYPNRSAPTPMPSLTSIYLSIFFKLLITIWKI